MTFIVATDATDQNTDTRTIRIYAADQFGRTFSVHQRDAYRFQSKHATPVIAGFRPISLVPHRG